MINRALIEQFLKNQCTAEEAAAVSNYLQNNPEELAALLPEQDWEAFEAGEYLHPVHTEQMLQTIRREMREMRAHRYRTLAAAAIVLLLGTGFMMWLYQHKPLQPATVIAQNGKIPIRDTIVTNTGNTHQHIVLPDGSVAMLEGQSTLQWRPGFTPDQRALYLKGAATFTVIKQEGRPFTVYSEHVATTALGTSFRIKAYDRSKTVKIRLLTGKVMVRPTGAQADKKLVYLTRGQECAFNKSQHSLMVYNYERIADSTLAGPIKGNIMENGEELLFTNVPLTEVMSRFEAVYHASINYSEKQLKNYSFTGQISKRDSLPHILETMAILNRLQVTEDSSGYHVFNPACNRPDQR